MKPRYALRKAAHDHYVFVNLNAPGWSSARWKWIHRDAFWGMFR